MKANFLFCLLAFLFINFNAGAQGSLSVGMVMYLPFNGNTLDVSGGGNHATNSGASLTSGSTGLSNTAYNFNGSSFMKVLHHSNLNPPKFSICAKVKVQGFYKGYCYNNIIITKGLQRTTGFYSLQHTQTQIWSCSVEDTTKHNYRIDVQNITTPLSTMETLPYLVKDVWDCLVATFDGDTAKMYVNGVLRFKYYEPLFGSNTADIFIGKMNSTTYPFYYTGSIDEIRVYDRALSQTEVTNYCGFTTPSNTISANFNDSTTDCFTRKFTDLSSVTSTAIKFWNWDFGDGVKSTLKNPSHTYASSGSFTVKLLVVDSNGYTDSITKILTVNKRKFANAGKDTSVCKDPAGILLPINASGGIKYNWSPTSGLSSAIIPNPVATIFGKTNYIVSVTDSIGCVDKDTINISVVENFANAGNDTTLCFKGGVATITLNGSGGNSYNWAPAAGLSNPSIAKPIATLTSPTNYVLTVVDSNGCVEKDTISLTATKFAIVAKDTIICIENGIGKVKLAAWGGVVYKWSPASFLDDPNTPTPTATITNETIFNVIVIDINGCEDNQSLKVSLDTSKVILTTKNFTACLGQNIQLSAQNASLYQWSPMSGIANPSDSITNLVYDGTSKYIVKGISFNGCISTDSLEIVRKKNNLTLFPQNLTGCGNEEKQVLATGATVYEWFPKKGLNNPLINNPVVTITESMDYLVTGKDGNGCIDSAYLNINRLKTPVVKIQENTEKVSCLNSQTTLRASGASTYLWSPEIYCETVASPITVVRPNRTTLFTIQGIDSNGCKGTDSILVVFDGNTIVKVPNAFTPNDDGINDKIKPIIVCDFILTEFSIYSRWGKKIFTSTNINTPWDGKLSGSPCDVGVYYYYIKGKNSRSDDVLLKGDITLVR